MLRLNLVNLLPVILLASPITGMSLPEDREQAINIQADSAERSASNGKEKTIYTGNVVMVQGSLKINGDLITILSENRSVTEIIALGKPAGFSQQTELEKPPTEGQAEKIQYQLVNDTVVMLNKASLVQGASVITGERIDYNMVTAQVKATGMVGVDAAGNPKKGDENSGRVNMILEPKRKTESNSNDALKNETAAINTIGDAVTAQPEILDAKTITATTKAAVTTHPVTIDPEQKVEPNKETNEQKTTKPTPETEIRNSNADAVSH